MGELAQGGQDPLAHLLVGLAVLPAGPAVEPAAELLGKARLDLGAGQPLPGADIDLAERLHREGGELVPGCNRLRRLQGAAECARVDGGDRLTGEGGREFLGLGAPDLVERRIGVALEAVIAVPVGLGVAGQEDLGQGRLG